MSSEIIKSDNKNILIMKEIPPFTIQDYDLFSDKEFTKYINDCERIIRVSFEYREFTNYLRNYMDMNKCSFFENVNNMDTFKIKIHIHHSPFTLYELVIIVFNKRQFYHEDLEIEQVAKEVMYIHYFLMIGLIPLAETVHELVHNQLIFIPLDKVMGNYEEFINIYKDFIPQDIIDKLEYIRQQTEIYNEAANIEILQQKPLLIQIPTEDGLSGTLKLPDMEKILELMKNRLIELKDVEKNNLIATKKNNEIFDNIEIDDNIYEYKVIDGDRIPFNKDGYMVPVSIES